LIAKRTGHYKIIWIRTCESETLGACAYSLASGTQYDHIDKSQATSVCTTYCTWITCNLCSIACRSAEKRGLIPSMASSSSRWLC
jgi:hypothetical protein